MLQLGKARTVGHLRFLAELFTAKPHALIDARTVHAYLSILFARCAVHRNIIRHVATLHVVCCMTGVRCTLYVACCSCLKQTDEVYVEWLTELLRHVGKVWSTHAVVLWSTQRHMPVR